MSIFFHHYRQCNAVKTCILQDTRNIILYSSMKCFEKHWKSINLNYHLQELCTHTHKCACLHVCLCVCVVCVCLCASVYVCARVYTLMHIRIEKYKGQIQKIMSIRMIEIQKENTTHNLQQ